MRWTKLSKNVIIYISCIFFKFKYNYQNLIIYEAIMRYSDYIKSVHFKHKSISYNLLTKKGPDNQKIKVSGQQAFNLIKPYCSTRIFEQMKAVIQF